MPVLLLLAAYALVVLAAALVVQRTPFSGLRSRLRLVACHLRSDAGTVTLAQAKLNTTDDIDLMIIDEFRKQSAVLDAMVFHDAVSGSGAGSTLTYGYTRAITQRAAAFRAINSEYTPEQATKARYTVDLKPLGGSFQIDRVLAQLARGAEVSFQLQQLVKATRTKFTDELINGDTGVDANGFDGLDKALTGSSTEINADGALTSNWTNLDTSGVAQGAYDLVDTLFGLLDGPPSLLITNDLVAAKLRSIARRANMYVEAPVSGLADEFGGPITRQRIGSAILVDAGEKAGSSDRIVPVYDPDNASFTLSIDAGADGGTYKLGVDVEGVYEETTALAYNANDAAIDAALEALGNVPASSVTVSSKVITFAGGLASADVLLTVADDSVTDGGVEPATPVTLTEGGDTGGYSDLYAVRIGMDGFHGVSVAGQPLLQTWLPDFARAGAVKTGEVEMGPVAVALKATKAAAVVRRIKVR